MNMTAKRGGTSNGTYKDNINGDIQFTFDSKYAKTDYSHILKPFNAYSARYKNSTTDITVNYTLDNYITIYGIVDGDEYAIRSGYLINTDGLAIEADTINVTLNSKNVMPEILSEKIWYEGLVEAKEFQYVYASDNTKVYFDSDDTTFIISSKGKRTDLGDSTIKYKKISILSSNERDRYYEIYQALNGKNKGKWYSDTDKLVEVGDFGQTNYSIDNDFSSINYYVESYCFTKWVNDKIGNITIRDMQNVNETSDYGENSNQIFNINENNDPEKEDSMYNLHKREVIKQALITNLDQAITSYARNSYGEYQLPNIKETDWDRIVNNVSIITFAQGIPIGLKNYNNYAIANSTSNNEYVNTDEIYITSTTDNYYHLPDCEHIDPSGEFIGYRNTDYLMQAEDDENIDSYYKHENISREACYYCIVDRASYKTGDNGNVILAYDTALSRERYNNRTTMMEKAQPVIIEPEAKELNITIRINPTNKGWQTERYTLVSDLELSYEKDGMYNTTISYQNKDEEHSYLRGTYSSGMYQKRIKNVRFPTGGSAITQYYDITITTTDRDGNKYEGNTEIKSVYWWNGLGILFGTAKYYESFYFNGNNSSETITLKLVE